MGLLKSIRRGAMWVTFGAAGGAAIVTVRHLLRTPQPLESILRGETHIDRRHGGDIYYNVVGAADAPALVLLHDFYPGASNFEFRAVFEPLSQGARIYAPDWLGFGMSERPNLAYTGEFFANSLAGFLRDVVKRPATVVARGLAANVAVRAASDAPQLFERLVLVSPAAQAGEGDEPTAAQAVAQTAQRFSLGLVPYALIATRPVLKRLAGGPAADEERVDHLYASAHQFGGHFAPLALLSGNLDLPIRNALPLLEPPLLLVSGEHDPRRSREVMEDLAVLNPHADLDIIANAGELVYEDQPGAFAAAVTAWIGMPASRHLIDERALLPQDDAAEAAATAVLDSAPAEDAGAPSISAEQQDQGGDEAEAAQDEALIGTPGYVVPGVSDMGMDGLSVVTVGGVANSEPEAQDAPDESALAAPDAKKEDQNSAFALLPEASEASPRDQAERLVREGVDSPTSDGVNIADLAVDERDETPTEPRRAARASGATSSDSSVSVPEMRTSAATRSTTRPKTQPSASRQNAMRQTAKGGTRSASVRRETDNTSADRPRGAKGAASRKNADKSQHGKGHPSAED